LIASKLLLGKSEFLSSKVGIMAFARCLSLEVASHHITANTIAPGYIHNEFLARIYPDEEIERMYQSIPYSRKGMPQDIANIALFMCSDEGEYVMGEPMALYRVCSKSL
jgi:NAD(P)-dependent dehydrogenase (short-subunit alcohol dehydrogenase family)